MQIEVTRPEHSACDRKPDHGVKERLASGGEVLGRRVVDLVFPLMSGNLSLVCAQGEVMP